MKVMATPVDEEKGEKDSSIQPWQTAAEVTVLKEKEQMLREEFGKLVLRSQVEESALFEIKDAISSRVEALFSESEDQASYEAALKADSKLAEMKSQRGNLEYALKKTIASRNDLQGCIHEVEMQLHEATLTAREKEAAQLIDLYIARLTQVATHCAFIEDRLQNLRELEQKADRLGVRHHLLETPVALRQAPTRKLSAEANERIELLEECRSQLIAIAKNKK